MNPHRATKQQVRKARKDVAKFIGKQTARAAGRLHSELFVVMVPKEARR
jgi:hypothetical protein